MKVLALALLFVLPVSAQVVVQTLDAPDTNISGLAFGAGSGWAFDNVTGWLYQFDTSTGAVQSSWFMDLAGAQARGLGFGNNQIYLVLSSGYVNIYSTSGSFVGTFSALC